MQPFFSHRAKFFQSNPHSTGIEQQTWNIQDTFSWKNQRANAAYFNGKSSTGIKQQRNKYLEAHIPRESDNEHKSDLENSHTGVTKQTEIKDIKKLDPVPFV